MRQTRISGEGGGGQKSYPLGGDGTHALVWVYSKDSNDTDGSDRSWGVLGTYHYLALVVAHDAAGWVWGNEGFASPPGEVPWRDRFPRGDKWQAAVQHDGKPMGLGLFDEEVEAASARDRKAYELAGELAVLNFPDEMPR